MQAITVTRLLLVQLLLFKTTVSQQNNNCMGEIQVVNGVTTCDGYIQVRCRGPMSDGEWFTVCEPSDNQETSLICDDLNGNIMIPRQESGNIQLHCSNGCGFRSLPAGMACTLAYVFCTPPTRSSCEVTRTCPTSTQTVMSTNTLTPCEEQVTTTKTVHMCTASPTAINRTVVVTLMRNHTIQSFIHYCESSSLRAVSQECSIPTITVESQKSCPVSTITIKSQKSCPISTITVESQKSCPVSTITIKSQKSCPISTITVESQKSCPVSAAKPSSSTEHTCTPKSVDNDDKTSSTDATLQDGSGATAQGGLGAFIAVQFLALIAVTIGWVCTCVQIKMKRSRKYTVANGENNFNNPLYNERVSITVANRENNFSNSLYNERVSITEPANVVAPAQHGTIDQPYEVLDTVPKHDPDDNHTYAVIPANRSKATKKRATTATQRRSVLSDVPATPPPIPSRGSICDANNHRSSTLVCDSRNPQRRSALVGIPQRQGEGSTQKSQEHVYHVLEQAVAKSSSPDTDITEVKHRLLEEGGMKGPSEHMLGRVSWSGPESGEGGVASPACSEEWEGKEPTSYEVPVKLLTAKDEGSQNTYS